MHWTLMTMANPLAASARSLVGVASLFWQLLFVLVD